MLRSLTLIATLAAATVAALPGRAGTPEEDALLAARVYAMGSEAQSWQQVAAAAEIMLTVDPEAGAMMLDRARDLATGDAEALAAIDDIASAGGRGCLTCHANLTVRGKLEPGFQDSYRVRFTHDRLGEVAVLAEDGAVLELEIVDDIGVTACTDSGTESYCSFQPKWDGEFVVTVRNSGTETASYYLVTAR